MQTMHPVVLHGCTTWDQERFPVDEFGERLRSVQKIMRKSALDGLIIYGDSRDYAKLCYLTNYIPKHSWAILLVPVFGEPCLLAKVAGSRDIPSVQLLTWIKDIRPVKQISVDVNQFILKLKESEKDSKPAIGICGGEYMSPSVYAELMSSYSYQEDSFISMDKVIDRLLQFKRPRELAVMREASSKLNSAVEAMQEIHRRGGSVVTAINEADRVARYLGAQDVRVLYSLDSGNSFQPFEILSEIRNDPMIAYIALEYLGYWVEAMVTLTQKRSPLYHSAVKLLDFLTESMKPDVKLGDLVHSATEMIKPYKLHPITPRGFGHSIGLSLEEQPFLELSNGGVKIEGGTVFSIHACLTDDKKDNVLLSTLILVNINGNEILWSSVNR